jgi:DNA repair protein RadD
VISTLTLRDYQAELKQAFKRACREESAAGRVPRVLAVLPTGGGKTPIIACIASESVDGGHRPVVVTHRDKLAWQVQETLQAMGVPCGLIQGKHGAHPWQPVQVAMVQSLSTTKRLAKYRFDRILIDEAHHSSADSYMKILVNYSHAWVGGFTATPIRKNGAPLNTVFNRMVEGPSSRWLMENINPATGLPYLCRAEVYCPRQIDVTGVAISKGEYVQRELEVVADDNAITGDAIKSYRELAHRKPAIANCVSVKHAEHVAQQFADAGYRTGTVCGATPPEGRRRILDLLGSGRIDLVAQVDLYGEGADIPLVECIIMLNPTKSLTRALQWMGRGLRPAKGKDHCVILDHAGVCARWHGDELRINHGFPDDEREWSLDTGVVAEASDSEPSFAVRQCPACFRVHRPAPVCPGCGHVYAVQSREVEHVQGELIKVDPKTARALAKAAAAKDKAARKAAFWRAVYACWNYADLVRVCVEHGYDPGYAKSIRNHTGWGKRAGGGRREAMHG